MYVYNDVIVVFDFFILCALYIYVRVCGGLNIDSTNKRPLRKYFQRGFVCPIESHLAAMVHSVFKWCFSLKKKNDRCAFTNF